MNDIKRYTSAAIAADLPRIVRSDITRQTELAAKYERLALDATSPEVSKQIGEALVSITNTRQALEHVARLLAAVPKEETTT